MPISQISKLYFYKEISKNLIFKFHIFFISALLNATVTLSKRCQSHRCRNRGKKEKANKHLTINLRIYISALNFNCINYLIIFNVFIRNDEKQILLNTGNIKNFFHSQNDLNNIWFLNLKLYHDLNCLYMFFWKPTFNFI